MDEKEFEYYLKKIAPSQKEIISEEAKRGKRISPTWMPDDIGTAYLRKMQ